MINNSTFSSSMSVADIAPRAATTQPASRKGDNAFGEALAGAHTVHDRRESQAAGQTQARRDQAPADRSRGQERASEVRSDNADRAHRTDEGQDRDIDVDATTAATAATAATDATRSETTTAADDDAAAPTSVDDPATTQAAPTADAADTATNTAGATAQTTVAVAAAPVVVDLDAIIVPTSTTVTHVATRAVDAAIRLAIDAEAAVTAPVETAAATTAAAATTTTTTAPAGTTVETDASLQLAAAIAPGAEDAETGDVQAGPTRPTTSTPATTSGPSPIQLAAATFTDANVETAAVTQAAPVVTAQVATAVVADVAAGDTADATAQLVQAAAVSTTDTDAQVVTTSDAAAAAAAKTAKADGAATTAVLDAKPELEADVPEVVQAAKLNQTQAPTVALNAQAQAQAQAKAAEQAADEGGEAAPAKLEPLSSSTQLGATRTDQAAATTSGVRVREGLQSQVQERIDHIAEQLATRLRLSHAAGGSQVQLSLKPRELGEVTVQMNIREGAVAATILVDRADTLKTLQTNIEDLKKSLESQGLQIGEFSVDVRGDSGAGGANARATADLRDAANRTATGSSASLAGAAAVTPGLSGDREVSAEEIHDGDVSVLA